ncbi:MAG: sigma 54-interacting transcriptional regulator [Ignavibacteriota bacterium]
MAQKKGKLELGEGGTIFLDEIGELAAPLQAKLLRVLQQREFERVGGTVTHRLDIRMIAATNRDLAAEARRGSISRGPLPSAERGGFEGSAAARSAGRHPGAGTPLSGTCLRTLSPSRRGDLGGG